MIKTGLLAGVAVAAMVLSLGSTAQAVPTLQYTISDGSTLIGSGSSTTGTVVLNGSDSRFTTVGGFASSAPLLTVPDFSTSVFSIQSTASNTSGTLTIRISATDLSGYAGGLLNYTSTLNSLNGGSFTSGTTSTYFDNNNTAFGTGTLLATDTFGNGGSFSRMTSLNAAPSALFSETTVYTLNYGAGGASTISASSQLNSVNVPEPASLAILGAGLVGAGLLRRRASKV